MNKNRARLLQRYSGLSLSRGWINEPESSLVYLQQPLPTVLTFRGPCIVIYSCNKTNETHWFLKFIFGMGLYVFRTVCLSIIRGSGRSILIPLANSQHNLYDIHLLLCVQCRTPEDGHKDCPKHVEFHSKYKFEKLVHLVGFVIRIFPLQVNSVTHFALPQQPVTELTSC